MGLLGCGLPGMMLLPTELRLLSPAQMNRAQTLPAASVSGSFHREGWSWRRLCGCFLLAEIKFTDCTPFE